MNKKVTKQVKNTSASWESRAVGADAQYVGVADESHEEALKEILEAQIKSLKARPEQPPLVPTKLAA